MADLTTTITESVIINGADRGSTKTLTTTGLKTCSICKFQFTGFGHNPQPVKDMKVSDRCCGECNDTVVIPLRFRTLNRELN